MGPSLRIFGENVTHLGSISLYAFRCEYHPLPWDNKLKLQSIG